MTLNAVQDNKSMSILDACGIQVDLREVPNDYAYAYVPGVALVAHLLKKHLHHKLNEILTNNPWYYIEVRYGDNHECEQTCYFEIKLDRNCEYNFLKRFEFNISKNQISLIDPVENISAQWELFQKLLDLFAEAI